MGGEIDFFIEDLPDKPSDTDMIALNSFRRVERLMQRIKEKYNEEGSYKEEDK